MGVIGLFSWINYEVAFTNDKKWIYKCRPYTYTSMYVCTHMNFGIKLFIL